MSEQREQLLVESREQWRDWLERNHSTSRGVWIVTWKMNRGRPHLPYNDIVEEALAVGWIDSQPRKLDEDRSQLLITPRKPGSNWSRLNKQRIERLTEACLMRDAGLAVVAAARADGSWKSLDEVEDLIEPADLRIALDRNRTSRENWDSFPRSTRRGILEWIGNAKTPATRAKRITETADKAAQGQRANQWPRPTARE
jgi:uncharacterized protein YdeI (YjbR/CyaY-like superfamily)